MQTNEAATERARRFTELFDAHHTAVSAYVRRRVSPALADDVVAESFLVAWTNFDRMPGEPLIWLYGLARGVVANARRREGRIGRLTERAATLDLREGGRDHADFVGWEGRFLEALGELSEPEREVLRITSWEGLTPTDGAVVLGCSVAAFKVRLHRARRHLRRLLDASDLAEPHPEPRSGRALPIIPRVVEIHAPLARSAFIATPKETP